MIATVASATRLLIACDFDGTLAPIVAHPDDARALPEAESALHRLAVIPDTWVAIVSGRQRSELVSRFGDDFILIGEHGADRGGPDPDEPPALGRARQEVQAVVAATDGSIIEHKPRSVTFHYRLSRHPEPALARLRRFVSSEPDLRVLEGKAIFEISVSHTNKGDAVAALRQELAADAVVFLGDDITDETVFLTLGPYDLGVRIGHGDSAAASRLDKPEDVAPFLEQLAAAREGA